MTPDAPEEPKQRRGLTKAAVAGTMWLGVARWVMRASHIGTMLLLARVLTPVEYGLVAVAKVFTNMMFLGSTGLQAAAIQRKGEIDHRVLDTAWTFDVLMFKSLVGLILFASAPLVADFFREPEIESMVRVLSLIPFIQALENNAKVVFSRQLEYRKRSMLEGVSGVSTFVMAVPLTLLWRDAWAFVVAYVFGWAMRTIASYIAYPRRPRLTFDLEIFKSLFGFGRWMLALKLLQITREQTASVVLGRMLGSTSLGYFQLGSRFSAQLATDFSQTTKRILFPIYAKVQGDRETMAKGYLRSLELAWLIIMPFAATLGALAAPATVTVFGDAWLPTAEIVEILCPVAVFRVTSSLAQPLFLGHGRPRYQFLIDLGYLLVLLPLLFVLTDSHGVVGTALAVLSVEAMMVPASLFFVLRSVPIRLSQIASRAGLPLLLAAVSGALAWLVSGALPQEQYIVRFLAAGSAAVAAYFVVLTFIYRVFGVQSVEVILKFFKRALRRRKNRQA